MRVSTSSLDCDFLAVMVHLCSYLSSLSFTLGEIAFIVSMKWQVIVQFNPSGPVLRLLFTLFFVDAYVGYVY